MVNQRIICADCVEWMRQQAPNTIDAIVTDPPYGLEFMGSEWDTFAVRLPREVLSARRFAHLTTVERLRRKDVTNQKQLELLVYQEWTRQWALEAMRILKPGAYMLAMSGTRTYHRMTAGLEDAGFIIRDCLCWVYASGFPKSYDISKGFDKRAGVERKITGDNPNYRSISGKLGYRGESTFSQTDGMATRKDNLITPLAHKWQGWGTALKPAWEPIVMVQKPLEGTYCENVEKWGVGGLNIDATRIPIESEIIPRLNKPYIRKHGETFGGAEDKRLGSITGFESKGRFPANVQVDSEPDSLLEEYTRFFVIPKASPHERGDANKHPTVKPIRLFKQMIKLVTPPGGTMLDPFVGSGTACLVASELDVNCIGIDKSEEYCDIARQRLASYK